MYYNALLRSNSIMNALRKPLQPLIELIATPFMWIHPNILSFGSFVVAAPGFYFYSQGDSLLGSLFIIGAMFDAIDGTVARKTGKSSAFGGILDATLDRIFDGAVLFFIGLGGFVSWELLFIAYISNVSVSYIKAKAEAAASESNVGTNRFSVGIGQRGERIGLILLGSIANGLWDISGYDNFFLKATLVLLILLSVITFFWRWLVISSELKRSVT